MEKNCGASLNTKKSSMSVQVINLAKKTPRASLDAKKSLAGLFGGKLISKQKGEDMLQKKTHGTFLDVEKCSMGYFSSRRTSDGKNCTRI
jgi:hypothetical protein